MDSGSAAPLSDVKVFKEYPSRHSALPQRNIFNVEIVDSHSGIPQVLDSLQRSGPLHFKGWVPIEETKHASVKNSGKFVYIFGEIIEWTHQYDPARPKRPIFWLKSYGVGWYKIESVTTAYERYFAPLAKVCSYLDVLVQLVVEMRAKDALDVLIPQVAVLLAEPESMVSRMLQKHRKQLLELGASDAIIRGSNFYKSWVADQAVDLAGSLGRTKVSHSPDVSGHVEYDTSADDMATITDSEIDVWSARSNRNHRHSHPADTDDSDVNATSLPLAASKLLLPMVSYDMADRDVIPEFETKVETYDELPAPCGDDFCFLHPVFKDVARNAISDDMRLLSSKFEPSRSGRLSSQLDPAIKIEPGLDAHSGEESITSGSLSVSEPGSFFCPVQGCLTTICNTTIPTSKEFIATVSQHIGTHDLSVGDTERVLRSYLAKPWKRPIKSKAWDVTANQLNTKTPTLNVHVYWMLNAKKSHDQRAPAYIPTTTPTRSTRKRAASQARVQITSASSLTSSPRATSVLRQTRGTSTSSVTQFLESSESASSITPLQHLEMETTVESTRTSLIQKTITASTTSLRSGPSRERYHSQFRELSSSPVRRGRSKRRPLSNDSNDSGNESIGPSRKRQHVGRPLQIDDTESDDFVGTEMGIGRAHGSRRGRSLSRGRVTVRRNEVQPTRRSSRSRSKARPNINATGTALRRSARSRSKPRPFGSASANEDQSSVGAHGRSISRGRVDNFNDNYANEQSGLGSEKEVGGSGSGPTFVYQSVSVHERGRSRTTKRIERAVLGTDVKSSLISKLLDVYRTPPIRPATMAVPMFMRCYRCQALIKASDEHRSCMELGSEDFPVVLTVDD